MNISFNLVWKLVCNFMSLDNKWSKKKLVCNFTSLDTKWSKKKHMQFLIESHVTGTWLWSSPVTLAVLLYWMHLSDEHINGDHFHPRWHRCKSIQIYGRCLWINRNLLYHFSFYLYCVHTSNFATWSGLDFKTNVKVVLFKRENLIKFDVCTQYK
jgi:hypothetical protein